ncbi:MAG: hypothetical protein WB621_20375, partial [Candidatus Acidiferrales bacterium]
PSTWMSLASVAAPLAQNPSRTTPARARIRSRSAQRKILSAAPPSFHAALPLRKQYLFGIGFAVAGAGFAFGLALLRGGLSQ